MSQVKLRDLSTVRNVDSTSFRIYGMSLPIMCIHIFTRVCVGKGHVGPLSEKGIGSRKTELTSPMRVFSSPMSGFSGLDECCRIEFHERQRNGKE